MHSTSRSTAIALVVPALLWAPMAAHAADAPTSANQSAGPTVTYESAFKGYRGYADEPVASWTNSNAVVGKIGGWRAYARESGAARNETPANVPPSPSTPAAPSPAGTHSPSHRVPPSP